MESVKMDILINEFYQSVSPYKILDLKSALKMLEPLYKMQTGEKLAELTWEYLEETSTDFTNVDICYIALNHILEMAQEKLYKIGFDIDLEEILKPDYNYMATSLNCEDGVLAESLGLDKNTFFDNFELLIFLIQENKENIKKEVMQ